jgi:CheY-like chemotaxis protein
MILNLVSNAIKFTSAGGSVEVRTRKTMTTVELSVTDTGIGISKSDQALIFQEFQQLKAGDSNPIPGTGLGLAITRRLARLHGGDVELSSELGTGSTFTLSLPVAGPDRVVTPEVDLEVVHEDLQRSDPSMTRQTVLVVDDNHDLRDLTEIILREAGYQVLGASAGPAAIELLANHPGVIDVLVTDVGLPGMNGVELAAAVKARRPELRVLLMSGTPNPTGTAKPASGSVFSALQKPFVASELLEAVQKLLTPVDENHHSRDAAHSYVV